jgi:Cu-Zn family superoxide dismutase
MATLYDADGSALVIHAGADDHVSQPSGAAGDRIACAEIQ